MIAIFADVPNLYHAALKKYNSRVDYDQLYTDICFAEGDVHKAIAYGLSVGDEADKFLACLRHIGFECKWRQLQKIQDTDKFKKADISVQLTVDALRFTDKVDTIVIVSGDANLAPLVEEVKNRGVKCVIYGIWISRELKQAADRWVELKGGAIVGGKKDDTPNESE